jgi:hypothetical protein
LFAEPEIVVSAIQELAGHADLTTTMRYMHLSPAARLDAIHLLNKREEVGDSFGPRWQGPSTSSARWSLRCAAATGRWRELDADRDGARASLRDGPPLVRERRRHARAQAAPIGR